MEKYLARLYNVKEDIELIYLIAGFNKHQLTEAEKDRLDELILKNETNMKLFEVLTDEVLTEPLQRVVESMKEIK